MTQPLDSQLRKAALEYHEQGTPGKLQILATKQMSNQRDLALAYSPGVAAACEEIVMDPANVFRYTTKGNMVGVITNGTAVLGLGNIGPLASKPVMEGKAVLFKKFAGIDVFDIEINETDPDQLIAIISALEPTFGGINLEDIKAPECFYIERELRKRMRIPVFHDDQHGTAIIVGAAILNGLKVLNKSIDQVKLVTSGAGAAALACLNLLVDLGLPKKNIWVTDLAGVVFEGRTELMDENKVQYSQKTDSRTLNDIIIDADIFLGLSAGGVLKPTMISKMAANPLILALANPTPEILPEEVWSVRQDAIVCTGRTDYPNQVNNVLCFPYIFRGALDVGATTITREMEIATVYAIAELAQVEQNDAVAAAYGIGQLSFGRDYLIPKPFDSRLIVKIAPAVAQAAMNAGVATRPIKDMAAYIASLQQFIYHSGSFMKPLFNMAKQANQQTKIVYCEGEEERVLRAIQIVVDEKLATPILIGRPAIIEKRLEKLGLRIKPGVDFTVVNPEQDARYRTYYTDYYQLMSRKGVSEPYAKIEMRRRHTLIGCMLVRHGEADGMICGTFGTPSLHLPYIDSVIGKRNHATCYAAMNGLMLPNRVVFLVDTHFNFDPSPQEICDITFMAAAELQRFGITPKVALLSHSNFGTADSSTAIKMRTALTLIRKNNPTFEVDGEMHGDSALDETIRNKQVQDSPLTGSANLLVFPNLDAANISYNLLKTAAGNNVAVGPLLLGANAPVHIVTASATVRRIVNLTALTVVDANVKR